MIVCSRSELWQDVESRWHNTELKRSRDVANIVANIGMNQHSDRHDFVRSRSHCVWSGSGRHKVYALHKARWNCWRYLSYIDTILQGLSRCFGRLNFYSPFTIFGSHRVSESFFSFHTCINCATAAFPCPHPEKELVFGIGIIFVLGYIVLKVVRVSQKNKGTFPATLSKTMGFFVFVLYNITDIFKCGPSKLLMTRNAQLCFCLVTIFWKGDTVAGVPILPYICVVLLLL